MAMHRNGWCHTMSILLFHTQFLKMRPGIWIPIASGVFRSNDINLGKLIVFNTKTRFSSASVEVWNITWHDDTRRKYLHGPVGIVAAWYMVSIYNSMKFCLYFVDISIISRSFHFLRQSKETRPSLIHCVVLCINEGDLFLSKHVV